LNSKLPLHHQEAGMSHQLLSLKMSLKSPLS